MANTKPDILFCAVVCAERAAYASPFVSSHFGTDEQPQWPAHDGADAKPDVEPNRHPHPQTNTGPHASTVHRADDVALTGAVAAADAGAIASSHHRLSIWNVPNNRPRNGRGWVRKLHRGKISGRTRPDGVHHLSGREVVR